MAFTQARLHNIRLTASVIVSVVVLIGSCLYAPSHALATIDTTTPETSIQNDQQPTTQEPITTEEATVLVPDTPPLPLEINTNESNLVESALPNEPTQEPTVSSVTDVTNDIQQQTTSGDALITENDDINNVDTGDATSDITIKNEVHDITLLGDGQTIIENIVPNQQDANTIIQPQQTATNIIDATPINTSEPILVAKDTNISNVIVVDTKSGDASIANNDDVGNVTSGNAISDIDILNLANAIIATGDIYVGTITIDGDYTGDIIISSDMLHNLDMSIQKTPSNKNVLLNNAEQIYSFVQAYAESGAVNADNNDSLGNTNTGDSSTFVLIKNYAGSYILYSNALLIIVNVLGDWTGNILGSNEPTAILTAKATDANPLLHDAQNDADILINNAITIQNNVSATSRSGDITIANNDTTGNTKTGSALVKVRILNIANTVVSFADWVGVLFINIFGDWTGSVVAETPKPIVPIIAPTPFVIPQKSPEPVPEPVSPTVAFTALFTPITTAESTPQITDTKNTKVAAAVTLNDTIPYHTTSTINDSSYLWILLLTIFGTGALASFYLPTYRQ